MVNNKNIEKKKEYVSSSGSRYYYPLEYKYSEVDKCFVPYYGKPVDRYEMIQAMAPSCDINFIVKRALAGDMTALNVRNGSYADITNIPDNLNDLNEFNNLTKKQFNELDPNLKNLFSNDFDKFSGAVADGSYETIINDFLSKKDVIIEKKKESEN